MYVAIFFKIALMINKMSGLAKNFADNFTKGNILNYYKNETVLFLFSNLKRVK